MMEVNNNRVGVLGTTLVVLLTLVFPTSHAFPSSVQPAPASMPPKSVEWRASTEFGEFKFTVNPEAKGINKLSFNFSKFKCGGVTISSGEVSFESLWPITGDQFTVNLSKIAIHGRFDETGTHATGTWKIDSIGAICSGTWESSLTRSPLVDNQPQ